LEEGGKMSELSNATGKGEVWVSMGITKSIGDYEFIRLDAGEKITVDDTTDPALWQELWERVEQQLEDKVVEINNESREAK
jgi:hypothetical protein